MLDDGPEQTVQTNPYLPCNIDATTPDEVYVLNDCKLDLRLMHYSIL